MASISPVARVFHLLRVSAANKLLNALIKTGARSILGTLLVLVSVVVITTAPGKKARDEWRGETHEAES